MEIRHIETPITGRFLQLDRDRDRVLVAFHGYGETADASMAELERIEGASSWTLLAIQALHPFYTRAGSVVASWMTSLDREAAIRDNITFVSRVLASIPSPRTLVYLGFSQGAAMAARAAAHVGRPDGLILLGGDIPGEIKTDASLRLPPTLLCRGERDDWYTNEKFKDDLNYLEATTTVSSLMLDAGHEWTDEFRHAAGEFLARLG